MFPLWWFMLTNRGRVDHRSLAMAEKNREKQGILAGYGGYREKGRTGLCRQQAQATFIPSLIALCVAVRVAPPCFLSLALSLSLSSYASRD